MKPASISGPIKAVKVDGIQRNCLRCIKKTINYHTFLKQSQRFSGKELLYYSCDTPFSFEKHFTEEREIFSSRSNGW